MPWGNGIVALRWNHLFSNKLFMNLTSTFSDSCERCTHFVQYKIEFTSKIMLSYIIISIVTNLSVVGVIFILFKFTQNYGVILLLSTLINTIQGCILWKIVKKIMNN